MRALLAAALILSAVFLAAYREVRAPLRAADAAPQPLVVPEGASAEAIGRQLRELGLVRHALIFRAVVTARGAEGKLRAGEYSLQGPLTLDQIVDMLVRGDVERREITFPEGKTVEDMALVVTAHGLDGVAFLKLARDPSPIRDLDPQAADLEGYLFPDTYDVARAPGAILGLSARMVRRFRDVVTPELPLLAEHNLSVRQLVTLASVVEMETAQAEERPRIAAVFLNRLKKGMPLQTDPTVIYAMRRAGSWDGNIRKRDLSIVSPYNTYVHAGLPPGPIASPGRASLQAVLHPAPVKDLYFVSRNDGTHQFSETLAEHERAVDRYQRHSRQGS